MTLEEARAEVESWFDVGPIGNYALAPTGETYVEICSGSQKDEGDRLPVLCSSPELAVKLWLQAVREYAPRRGTLYWRILPELDEADVHRVGPNGKCELPDETRKVYFVYSRLLVSDKPQIQPAIAPSHAA